MQHQDMLKANQLLVSWSHLTKTMTQHRKSSILRWFLTISDIWSCNRSGDNGQKMTTSKILAIWKCLSWSHLDKNMIKHGIGQGMIQWCISKYWVIYDQVIKVRSVDKNCPLIKFVGQHGNSCLGHKRPKMLKNWELRTWRVDTTLGQCDLLLLVLLSSMNFVSHLAN